MEDESTLEKKNSMSVCYGLWLSLAKIEVAAKF